MAGAVRNRTGSRRLHGQGRRLTGARVGHCMWGAGLRSRRRDGVADQERCRRCPGLRRRAPAGLVELPCVRPAAWPSPLSSPVSRVRAAAWRTWFVVEPFRQFSGSLRERQTASRPGSWSMAYRRPGHKGLGNERLTSRVPSSVSERPVCSALGQGTPPHGHPGVLPSTPFSRCSR